MHDEGEEENGGEDLVGERQGSTKNLQFSDMANEPLCLAFTQLPFFGTPQFLIIHHFISNIVFT